MYEIEICDYDVQEEGEEDEDLNISSLSIPDSVKVLKQWAISNCLSLGSIVLPQTLEVIEDFAISGAMVSVNVPSTVHHIGMGSIYSPNLESINVHAENPYYKTIDGVVYSKDGATLIAYPANKSGSEFYIPSFVTKIYGYAFAGCNNLETIHIPAGVTEIGDNAFYGCANLANIVVDEENISFATDGNILFSYDMTELVFYPTTLYSEEYHLPLCVTNVRIDAIQVSRLYIHNTEQVVMFEGFTNGITIYVPLSLYYDYCGFHRHKYIDFQRITVSFNYEDHYIEQYLNYMDMATEPEEPTSQYYTVFKGWGESYSEIFDFSEPVTRSITLSPQWLIMYEVAFMSEGECLYSSEVENETALAAPADPVREGYTFEGWYTDEYFSQLYNFYDLVTYPLTLYAKWTQE